jgi:hypothetical protein
MRGGAPYMGICIDLRRRSGRHISKHPLQAFAESNSGEICKDFGDSERDRFWHGDCSVVSQVNEDHRRMTTEAEVG